jgi:hypothetical protein
MRWLRRCLEARIFGLMDAFCESELCLPLFGLLTRPRIPACRFLSVLLAKYESIETIDNLSLAFRGLEFMRV